MTDKNPLAHYSGVLSEAVQESAAEQIPVSGQSRFHGQKWAECSVEHVAMVLSAPHEWEGYEVRYLYAAPAQAAPEAVAVPDGIAAFEKLLDASMAALTDQSSSKEHVQIWDDAHDALEAWKARAALAATPAAVEVPAEGDPAALLQLAYLIESGRGMNYVERKEIAVALRVLAATPAATAPVVLPQPVGSMSATTPRTVAWNCAFMPEAGTRLYTEQQLRAALLAGVSAPAAQAVASIYVTADGQRECDDWKVPLPIGRNLLYTAPQAQADARDAEQEKPPAGRYVLAWMEGREIPIRAMWVPKSWLVAGDECPEGWAEYDEEKDEYYCPEGWYEANEHEETHWHVSTPIVAWADLPRRAANAAQAAQQTQGGEHG